MALAIYDIAHRLSLCCRWSGSVPYHYSVAQHCVIASKHLTLKFNQLLLLLHDAAEAFIGDLSRPVKITRDLKGYRNLEHKLQKAILKQFIPDEALKTLSLRMDTIKSVDLSLCAAEGLHFFGLVPPDLAALGVLPLKDVTIEPITPAQAEADFLDRYFALSGDTRQQF
jgi:hypothetical protein